MSSSELLDNSSNEQFRGGGKGKRGEGGEGGGCFESHWDRNLGKDFIQVQEIGGLIMWKEK